MKRAIVFGSSGFVGSHLLSELLNSSDYGQVTAVARKSLNITHPRLRTLIGDYNSFASVKSEIAADEVFIALGTTKTNSPKKDEYYQVDHEYPVLAARIAKERGAKSVFLVTAVGADPNSKFFYVRTKGDRARRDRTQFRAYAYLSPLNDHGEQERETFAARRSTDEVLVCFKSSLNVERR